MNTGKVSIPSPQAISTAASEVANRVNQFGEQFVVNYLNGDQSACLSGDYYMATNPTPGTGLATIAALATLANTSPFILITNLDTSRTITLDFVRFVCTVVGTNGADFHFAVLTDNITTRFSSGGSVITPVNCNQGSSNSIATNVVQINAGALIANAANSARLLDHVRTRVVIPVAGDTTIFTFGAVENGVSGAAVNGSVPSSFSFGVAPCVIGPSSCAALHIWSTTQSVAAQYEFSLGFIFR